MSPSRAPGSRWAAALAVVCLVLAACPSRRENAPAGGEGASSEVPSVELPVEIYFPNDEGRLVPERHDVSTNRQPQDLARAIVETLLAGPRDEALQRPFPAATRLNMMQIGSDGVAFVDLSAEGIELPLPAGSTEERLIVMSLVGSLTLNVPEIRQVVLLWNGVQPATLAGHLDLSRPLVADRSLVER